MIIRPTPALPNFEITPSHESAKEDTRKQEEKKKREEKKDGSKFTVENAAASQSEITAPAPETVPLPSSQAVIDLLNRSNVSPKQTKKNAFTANAHAEPVDSQKKINGSF